MARRDDDTPTPAWRRLVRAELRRSRRYLLALVEDLSEDDGAWMAPRPDSSCAKWHAGRVAAQERGLWAKQASLLGAEPLEEDAAFAPSARLDRAVIRPAWKDVRGALARSRRLTEAVLDNASLRSRVEQALLDAVNLDYDQARFIRALRRELGRADLAEPQSRLIHADTDAEAPPRFHVARWEPAPPPAERRGEVASLAERRSKRARQLLATGHRLAQVGDHRGALAEFEQAASLERTADALTFMGWMHALLGREDRAEQLCLEAIALDPDFGNPYNDIGTICLRRREVPQAIEWFERAKRARRYEPRHFPFMNLGRLYASLDMPEKALQEFEDAQALAPGNDEIRLAIESLRRKLGRRERG